MKPAKISIACLRQCPKLASSFTFQAIQHVRAHLGPKQDLGHLLLGGAHPATDRLQVRYHPVYGGIVSTIVFQNG